MTKNYDKSGEVAKMLGVSTRTIQNYCMNGQLTEEVFVNSRRFIPKESVIAFLKEKGIYLETEEERKDVIYARVGNSKAITSSQAKTVLFNAKYYANSYADLKKAFGYNEASIYNHYKSYGIHEGRSASPIFDPVYYLNNNSDLKRAFDNNYPELPSLSGSTRYFDSTN